MNFPFSASAIESFFSDESTILVKKFLNSAFADVTQVMSILDDMDSTSSEDAVDAAERIAVELQSEIEKIKNSEKAAKDFFSDGQHRLHKTFRHDHLDNIDMCNKIIAFCSDVAAFFEVIKLSFCNEFSERLTPQLATDAERIINAIDLWYESNNLAIPLKSEGHAEVEILTQQFQYFS